MSRTTRRTKNITLKTFNKESDFTFKRPDEWIGYSKSLSSCYSQPWMQLWFPRLKLEGKEFKKAKAFYHSDNGPTGNQNRWYDSEVLEEEGCCRVKWKKEISKWINDPDYEIIFRKRKTPWEYS